MKVFLAAGAVLAAAPLAATETNSQANLPQQEVTIPSGGIAQFAMGSGNNVFVSDRTNRWYRIVVNPGCTANLGHVDSIHFERSGSVGPIDRFATLYLNDGMERACAIQSIHRSAVPPQFNSKSPIKRD